MRSTVAGNVNYSLSLEENTTYIFKALRYPDEAMLNQQTLRKRGRSVHISHLAIELAPILTRKPRWLHYTLSCGEP